MSHGLEIIVVILVQSCNVSTEDFNFNNKLLKLSTKCVNIVAVWQLSASLYVSERSY